MSTPLKSIKSNLLNFIINAVVIFVMTPILIKNMGDHNYGIFAIALSIVGYMSILDLGLNPAVTRYISKYSAVDDNSNTEKYYTTALLLLSAMGVIATSILIGIYAYDPQFLAPDGEPYNKQYSYALILIMMQVLLVFPRVCFIATLNGKNLFSVHNNISIVLSLVSASLIVYFIDGNNGLVLVLLVGLLSEIIKTVYLGFYIRFRLRIRLYVSSLSEFKSTSIEMLKFGGKSFVQGASNRLAIYSDNIIIAGFLNASYIVTYSLPIALIGQVYSIVSNICIVYLPMFSEIHAKEDKQKLIEVYMSATRLISSISIFSLGAIYILSDNFIGMWIGPEYAEKSSEIIPYLIMHGFVYLFNPLANQLVTALNKHYMFSKLSIIETLINISISSIMINYMGLVGVALGTLVSCLLTKIYKTTYCARLLSVSLWDLCIIPVRPILIPALLPLLLIIYFDDYANTLFSFIVVCILACLTWLVLMMLIGVTKQERSIFFREMLPKGYDKK